MTDLSATDDAALLALALAWRETGQRVAVATVVSTWGSAPRPAGSLLVCNEAGAFAGSVSGGCVEVAVIESATEVMQDGAPRLLEFGVSDEQALSVGLACGGRIRVWVEALDQVLRPGLLHALLDARQAARAVALFTPLDGGPHRLLDAAGLDLLALTEPELAAAGRSALASDRVQLASGGAQEVMITPHNPPLRLIVVGAVHISESLCTMARAAGYVVSLIDPRTAFLRPERFPGVTLIDEWPQSAFARLRPDKRTAVVLLTHDPKIDDPALLAVLPTPAFYIGALGSTRTHAKRLQRLAEAGVQESGRARIRGPAGLAIGARTPAEIAISVLAEITQELRS
ncbi:MAG TPA: XdhC/CoxI family protein [Steroidobacteraceae bacterium]|nr:XdhC/CoxI family protein [Steroidobacteraceae bacterium]